MENEVVAKIPPNDQEAEQAVLGAMLTDKDAAVALLPKVASMLDKLAKKNIIHKNKAANLKSGLQVHVNAL